MSAPRPATPGGAAPADPAAEALAGLAASGSLGTWLERRRPPAGAATRDAAVLMLFGRGQPPRTSAGRDEVERLTDLGAGDVDVVLLQRAATLRSHAGQVAFPGGKRDPEDADAVAAALRETHEETGVEPAAIEVLGQLGALYVPASGFCVTPVLGWAGTAHEVRVVDEAESASVYRVAVADLVAPANRGTFAVPGTGYVSPVFDAGVLRAWGFTAGLLEGVFDALGWARPWDRERRLDVRY